MAGNRGGKRPGAGRPPGPGKWSKDARDLRAKLQSMGKSPLEILCANMLAWQEEADAIAAKMKAVIEADGFAAMDLDRLKQFRSLIHSCAGLRERANKAASDAAPYLVPKVTQKDEAIEIDLPKLETVSDVVSAIDFIMAQIAVGTITTDQGQKLSQIVEAKRKAIETLELERRIAAMEEKAK